MPPEPAEGNAATSPERPIEVSAVSASGARFRKEKSTSSCRDDDFTPGRSGRLPVLRFAGTDLFGICWAPEVLTAGFSAAGPGIFGSLLFALGLEPERIPPIKGLLPCLRGGVPAAGR